MIKSVYFLCSPTGPADNTPYYHNLIALAEGFKDLGIDIFANCNYWYNGEEFLLKATDLSFENFDLVIFDSQVYDMGLTDFLPKNLFSQKRSYKLVMNDASDGYETPGFRSEIRNVDIVLKSHYNRLHSYPENFYPWQFGLTNRIIESIMPLPYAQRNKDFLNNFRVFHPLREKAQKKVVPFFREILNENAVVDSFSEEIKNEDNLSYWHQTGRRHYPNFYQRLSSSLACFCFGGNPQKFFYNQSNLLYKLLYKIDWRMPIFNYNSIYQFDSWRFWETLAAGTCAVHIDFDKYGAIFPVQPKNRVHYLGYDMGNVWNTHKLIINNPSMIEDIGAAGREWVLEHYSPRKTAERFLKFFK